MSNIAQKLIKLNELKSLREQDKSLNSNRNNDGFIHAFGYTRVSTKMQKDDGKSLPAQKHKIEKYCLDKDIKLDNIYTDAALSGGNKDRPQFNEMLQNLRPNMKVIVTDADRFARSIAHVIEFKNIIHEKKCSIYLINQDLDTSNPISDSIFNILSCFAELERKNTKAKISSVMQDMSRDNKLQKKPRYGYKMDKINHILIPDDEEQIVIDIIRDIIIEDPKITLTTISKRLEDMNITIRKCVKPYPTTIKNIIEANGLKHSQQ